MDGGNYGGGVLVVWTADLVGGRLIEAMQVLRNQPPVKLGFTSGGNWPSPVRSFTDVLGAEETRDRTKWEWGRGFTSSSPAEVSRMEEAIVWPARYLKDQEGMCRCLKVWLLCKAYRRSQAKALRRKDWSKATFRRRVNQALETICAGLNGDGIALRESGE